MATSSAINRTCKDDSGQKLEADGSEDLHMMSMMSQGNTARNEGSGDGSWKTQYTVGELNKLMEDGMTLEQIFEEEKKNPLPGRTW